MHTKKLNIKKMVNLCVPAIFIHFQRQSQNRHSREGGDPCTICRALIRGFWRFLKEKMDSCLRGNDRGGGLVWGTLQQLFKYLNFLINGRFIAIKTWMIVLFCIVIFAGTFGCQQQSREFDAWKWKWPVWGKPAQSPTTQNSPTDKPDNPASVATISNYFTIRILESTGSDRQLNEAWSYLDEAAPISEDWQLLHRNGLRCGIGQYSDWPTVKEQFEKSGTRVKTELQVSLASFAPMNILADQMKSERTIFYYDREGRTHGRDFGPSTMQFTMTMAGRMTGGRVRTIFTPRILKPTTSLEQLAGKENRKSMTEQELENFGIVVDLGPEEFAIIGPSSQTMAGSLVGSQLFLGWHEGQRRSTFILISAAKLDTEKK